MSDIDGFNLFHLVKSAAHGHLSCGARAQRNDLPPEKIATETGYVLKHPSRWY
ncbi:hypothetical protein [Ectothiorhodospira haloalkaliphila]|uniref:hypothetical protein n=1 Tax=Ectothiorhodospira haloalkaliphila TaxID=421628 RepID=UPI0004AC88A9|nr:hypothetical protein [Ectothiorhodospira haloalkaliphila]